MTFAGSQKCPTDERYEENWLIYGCLWSAESYIKSETEIPLALTIMRCFALNFVNNFNFI